ncbi:MAG: lipid-binding SYLF domain-containing protein [Deltaproteobacteria bacterium]|nr:lipid-binding SYLF domain-containing protein [Deltaproteobacteria bacterium]
MKRIIPAFVFCVAVGLFMGSFTVYAQTKEDADILVDKARIVLEEMMRSQDSAPPKDLIGKCTGIAIIPEFFKAGFIAGGAYGKGVVLARRDGTWSGPAFVYMGAGSVGIQFGVQMTDLLLVVMGEKSMQAFLKSGFKLGADAAVAAGPYGAQVTAASEILLKGGIFSYSRAKGLFAGISLEGAGMGTDFGLNRAYYQTASDPEQILFGDVEIPLSAKGLIRSLEQIK